MSTSIRRRLWIGMLGAAAGLAALSGAARAQVPDVGCSNATLKGDYAGSIQGELLGILTGTAPNQVLHPFASPLLINAVAMAHSDGAGGLTQVDFTVQNGKVRPGPQTDPTTDFNINETGTYTVFPDCTGNLEIDDPPHPGGTVIKGKFVVARQGRETHGVTDELHVPAAPTAADGTTCTPPAGCDLGVNVRFDDVKLGLGEGEKLGLGGPNIQ